MLAVLVDGMQENMSDILGHTFMQMELGNQAKGQIFTPYPVCQMSARMVFDENQTEKIISDRGFITLNEPASGGGAMIIAFAEAMKEADINYQQHLHVTAIDIDIKAVCMTYIQLTLLHIPAIIIHGNALSLDEWSHWYTPAHILGGWNKKLRRQATTSLVIEEIETHEPAEIPIATMLARNPEETQLPLF